MKPNKVMHFLPKIGKRINKEVNINTVKQYQTTNKTKCNVCHSSGWDCRRVIKSGTLDFYVILSLLLISMLF